MAAAPTVKIRCPRNQDRGCRSQRREDAGTELTEPKTACVFIDKVECAHSVIVTQGMDCAASLTTKPPPPRSPFSSRQW